MKSDTVVFPLDIINSLHQHKIIANNINLHLYLSLLLTFGLPFSLF